MSLETIIVNVGGTLDNRSDCTTKSIVCDSFKLSTGASNGYGLQSDVSGNGSWQNVGNPLLSAAPPIYLTANVLSIQETGNLKVTANQLNTIQDISSASTVAFSGLNSTSTISSTFSTSNLTTGALSAISAGVAWQNVTLGNVLIVVSYKNTPGATNVISGGVGPTTTPVVTARTPTYSGASQFILSFIVPKNYYLLIQNSSAVGSESISFVAFPSA